MVTPVAKGQPSPDVPLSRPNNLLLLLFFLIYFLPCRESEGGKGNGKTESPGNKEAVPQVLVKLGQPGPWGGGVGSGLVPLPRRGRAPDKRRHGERRRGPDDPPRPVARPQRPAAPGYLREGVHLADDALALLEGRVLSVAGAGARDEAAAPEDAEGPRLRLRAAGGRRVEEVEDATRTLRGPAVRPIAAADRVARVGGGQGVVVREVAGPPPVHPPPVQVRVPVLPQVAGKAAPRRGP